MTRSGFYNFLKTVFAEMGFICKNSHFYKTEEDNEKVIVFGLQRSYCGPYYYLEYGFYIKSINKHLPFPKYNQLNLNCGRIMTSHGKAIVLDELDNAYLEELKYLIKQSFITMRTLVYMENEELINYLFNEFNHRIWYILGDETAAYFGMTRKDFCYHFVEE